jgi:deoxyadenosine/deoxycytidine kinase
MRYNRIVIEGNIGAGKTSLVNRLAGDLNAVRVLETFSDNPFLPLFYQNPARYALPLELFFMAERFQQLRDVFGKPELFSQAVVGDYMFHKSLVFAKVTLTDPEFALYSRIFNMMNPQLVPPDIIVYLHAPVERLLENISRRGRPYEVAITAEYLTRISATYMNYFRQQNQQRVLILDASERDFVKDNRAYDAVKAALEIEYPPGLSFEIV